MPTDHPLRPWEEPYWETFLEIHPLTMEEEGAFMLYLERPDAAPVTNLDSLEFAYEGWRRMIDPGR